MELSQLRKELTQSDVTFNVGEEEVKAKVNLGGLSPNSQALLMGFEQGEIKDLTSIVDVMCDIVADWDIHNDGEPFPPTRENISTLPVELLMIILSGLLEGVGDLGKDGETPSSESTKPKAKPRQSSKPKSRSGSRS